MRGTGSIMLGAAEASRGVPWRGVARVHIAAPERAAGGSMKSMIRPGAGGFAAVAEVATRQK
jgi:hypothetical protein